MHAVGIISKRQVLDNKASMDATQQGYMRGQHQGVHSTKPNKNDKAQRIQITVEEEKDSEKLQGEDTGNTKPIKKENDILIEV